MRKIIAKSLILRSLRGLLWFLVILSILITALVAIIFISAIFGNECPSDEVPLGVCEIEGFSCTFRQAFLTEKQTIAELVLTNDDAEPISITDADDYDVMVIMRSRPACTVETTSLAPGSSTLLRCAWGATASEGEQIDGVFALTYSVGDGAPQTVRGTYSGYADYRDFSFRSCKR